MMVAKIHIKDSYVKLNDDGVWESPKASLAKLFNVLFNKEKILPSPAAGISQFANQVRKANATFGGEVEWAASGVGEGVIY